MDSLFDALESSIKHSLRAKYQEKIDLSATVVID